MRIISGKYKGKNITGFNIDGTRPTMDRVKESLFGIIQKKLENAICLDLFAGSGSLGIEAISNNAKSCYFVDNNKEVIKTLKENLKNINEEYYIIQNDYEKALININQKYNLIDKSIKLILEYDLLNKDGIIVCEYENEVFSCPLEIIKEKKYGSKNIRIYEK